MGLTLPDLQHLLEARRGGSGGKVVTLGRQNVYLHPADLRRLRVTVGDDAVAMAWLRQYKWGQYAESCLRNLLRFDAVDSVDFSAYEGASIIHDFGKPLPSALAGQYDLALDGGSLEHIFNFPVAIANLMQLVRDGGIVYLANPSNNLCGHGFYQFSPELMYRVFSAENGFEPIFVRLLRSRYAAVVLSSRHAIFDVTDPARAGTRVDLQNSRPVVMMTMARKISSCEPFAANVLQSDYAQEWSVADSAALPPGRLRGLVKAALGWDTPRAWSGPLINAYLRLHASFLNRRHYRRVSPGAPVTARTQRQE